MKNLLFCLLLFTCKLSFSQVLNDYRSATTGNWGTVGTWQRFNGTVWIAATVVPNSTVNEIRILASHTVTIAATVSIDQVIVDAGGILSWTAGALTIANGAGIDLSIFGEFRDFRGGATSVTIPAGAKWTLNTSGTISRNSGNSSNNWQNNYEGGIATIGAGTTWRLIKNGAGNPSITTVGAFYGNLIFENTTAATWDATSVASQFQGGGNPMIKGNLDIGATGPQGIKFYGLNNGNVSVLGNTIIRSGSTYVLGSQSLLLSGNLQIDGTLDYSGTFTRILTFTGGVAQTVSGSGTANVFNITVNKSANEVTLSRPLSIVNLATFTSGIVFTSTANLLTISSTGSVSGANNASYVHGPVRYNGAAAFVFPVGKPYGGSKYYRPISINASAAGVEDIFYTEPFLTSPGLWTEVNTGVNDADANFFIVGNGEQGLSAGSCGSAAGSDMSLHVGSTFFPTGGAAYNAGGFCAFGICVLTSKRHESPIINCAGKTGIQCRFNYIENGQNTIDNAQLWYFDGASWTMIDDMPKTALTCDPQGTWTARTVSLPASANNNPNVRIGFSWVNNDDGIGTDPSFAVDDIELFVPGTASDPFVAEYFVANPQTVFNNVLEPSIDHISSCEYWVLDRIGASTSKVVTLSWNNAMWPSAQCDVTNTADLIVARWDGTMWRNHGNGGVSGTVSAGTIPTSAPVTAFSPFTLASTTTANPLPIELSLFRADCENGGVKLSWNTESEKNLDKFVIEYSTDIQNWNTVLEQTASGDKLVGSSYYHWTRLNGLNYFRIKSIDKDGSSYVYDPIALKCSENEEISVFPNPASEFITILVPTANSIVEILDLQGKVVVEIEKKDAITYTSKIQNLAKGVYIISVFDGKQTQFKRLIKE